VHWVDTEEALFTELIRIVQCLDPDVVTGWDIQAESLGYLAERSLRLGQGSLLKALSRTPHKSVLRTHALLPAFAALLWPKTGVRRNQALRKGGGAGGVAMGRGGEKGSNETKLQSSDSERAQQGGAGGGTPGVHRGSEAAPGEAPKEAADQGQSPLLSPGLTPDFPALSPSPLGASQGGPEARQGALGCTQGGSQDFLRSFAAVSAEAQALLPAQAAPGGQHRAPQQQNLAAAAAAAGVATNHRAWVCPPSRGCWGAAGGAEDARWHESGRQRGSTGATKSHQGRGSRQEAVVGDEWGRTQGSGLYIEGRIVLNLWRIFRSEIKLPIYTFESVTEAVLLRQVPKYDCPTLSAWFAHGGTPGAGAAWPTLPRGRSCVWK